MDELFLSHYYHKDLEPFRSISLNTEKTDEIVSRLSQIRGKAYGRFRNYEWYSSQRKETEQWLYKNYVEAGGIPIISNPIYFILGNSEYLESCYGENVKIYRIRFDEILEKKYRLLFQIVCLFMYLVKKEKCSCV